MTRTTIATDDFERADGLIGANWLYNRPTTWQASSPYISSGKVHGLSTFANWQAACWVGSGSFTDDQFSTVMLDGLAWYTSDYIVGCTVRGSGVDATYNGYAVQILLDSGTGDYSTYIINIINGSPGLVNATGSIAWVNGDACTLEVQGSTLRLYRNSTLLDTVTDTNVTTGTPGILVAGSYADSDKALLTSWTGGNITASAPAQINRRLLLGVGA